MDDGARQPAPLGVVQQLDDTFDRWEMKLGVLEMTVDHASPVDELEREFRNQEDAADLRAELEALGTDVGFREVEVRDGQLWVNGRAVLVKGVNRHDHSQLEGKVVSRHVKEPT